MNIMNFDNLVSRFCRQGEQNIGTRRNMNSDPSKEIEPWLTQRATKAIEQETPEGTTTKGLAFLAHLRELRDK